MNRPEIIGYQQDGPMDQWGAKLQMQSAIAPSEPAGPLPVVGSGGVVGLRSFASVEDVCRHMESLADLRFDLDDESEADVLYHAAEILRRHAAATSKRQPEPNGRDEGRAGND